MAKRADPLAQYNAKRDFALTPEPAGKVEKDATVMLNVTGGGEEHFKEGKELWYLKPSHVFPLEPDTDDVVAKVEALFN